jgi:hypothetical protein
MRVIHKHGGNISKAAREMGLARSTIQNRRMHAEDRGIDHNWEPEKVAPQADLSQVERMLGSGATLHAITTKIGAPVGDVLDEIDRLHSEGRHIIRRGDFYVIEKALPVGNVGDRQRFTTDSNNRIRFGISSDKHYASKYAREDVVGELYSWFAEEGIEHVLDGGNWIDGEARFNRYDIKAHGLEAQCQYLAKKLPEHPGLTTYAIAGDDHEGWYAQREGVDIGRYCEGVFRNAGREDWVNLGYMEAFFDIVNANSGMTAQGLLMHPGGGSSYAHSYRPQKIVESFAGGEKPAALFIGHYHKVGLYMIRNVWTVQMGCGQDQTPFMRKKSIDAHVAGGIIEFTQDPETGALIGCRPEFRVYYNTGYYNHRWTPHTLPTLPDRKANRE